MQPFKLTPAYKEYLWGGHRLKRDYGKIVDLSTLAESWELSAHHDGNSVIATGELVGMPFSRFSRRYPEKCGTRWAGTGDFPIMIKLLDSSKLLSVQVHPNEEYGSRVENESGKTEMWIVLDCEPDAYLYLGVNRELSREELRRRVEAQTVTEVLRRIPVHPGDVFYIPAGTIHSLGAGITVAEVQQTSNCTYRLYDFGRLDANGQLRQLHVDKALEVVTLIPTCPVPPGRGRPVEQPEYTIERLADCDYFMVDMLDLKGSYLQEMDGGSFVAVLCLRGSGAVCWRDTTLPLAKGESAFVPADAGEYALEGNGRFLLTAL